MKIKAVVLCIWCICITGESVASNNPISKGLNNLLFAADSYLGFTAEERENNAKILEVCKGFLNEDGNEHWEITEPMGCHETRFFCFSNPRAQRAHGFGVQIINLDKHAGKFPGKNVGNIWNSKEKKLLDYAHVDSEIYESSHSKMVWRTIEYDKNRKKVWRDTLTSMEIINNNLIYKTLSSKDKTFSDQEIALWTKRFEQIPAA